MYVVKFTKEAQQDVLALQKHSPKSISKLMKLVDELKEHPRTGTGQVEQLKGFKIETWSRRISKEHRLVYEIHDDEILVIVVAAFGHYK